MRDSKDQGIGDGGAFGAESREDGEQRRDLGLVSEGALEADGGVGCPHAQPQGDVHHSDLSDADLGAGGVSVDVAAQRRHVHLGGLFPQRFLVLADGADDVEVAEADDGQGKAVVEDEQCDRVGNRLQKTSNTFIV